MSAAQGEISRFGLVLSSLWGARQLLEPIGESQFWKGGCLSGLRGCAFVWVWWLNTCVLAKCAMVVGNRLGASYVDACRDWIELSREIIVINA